MTAPFGTVSIVIPAWNRPDLLRSVLESISTQTYPIEKTIVVDDASTDPLAPIAAPFGAEVIRQESHGGFAATVNRGLAQTSSDWVVLLNNDVQIPPGWISTIVAAARSYRADFATGKLLDAFNPERIDGTYDLISRGATSWRCGNGRLDGPEWSQPARIHLAPFTAVLLRSSAISSTGGLDVRFGSYLEDVDWCLRLAARGGRGVYVPSAVAVHQGSATLGAWRNATVRLISRNQVLLYYKHFRGGPVRPALVAQLLWVALAFRRGTGWSAVHGLVDGMRAGRSWRREPSDWMAVKSIIAESEGMIFSIQSEYGFDTYWRLYFRCVGIQHP